MSATLFLPPSGGGRLGWGWLRGFRQNQIVQPVEPPSPQPSPAGRERGQVARRDIDFCRTTVIPAQAGIYFSATEILRTIQKNLISLMDSRLRGNDGDGVVAEV